MLQLGYLLSSSSIMLCEFPLPSAVPSVGPSGLPGGVTQAHHSRHQDKINVPLCGLCCRLVLPSGSSLFVLWNARFNHSSYTLEGCPLMLQPLKPKENTDIASPLVSWQTPTGISTHLSESMIMIILSLPDGQESNARDYLWRW